MGILERLRGGPPPAGPERRPLRPLNEELERHLCAFVWGRAPIEPFIEELLRSQVAVLFHGTPGPEGPPSPLRPLVLTSSKGFPAACIFTHPDRCASVQGEHPEFQTGLQVEFGWVLRSLPDGLGLIVDPGWDVTVEQTAEGVTELRTALGLDAAKAG